MTRLFLALLTFLLLSTAFAQTCLSELQAGLSQDELADPATGRDAALYLERAVNLLEPVLPPLANIGDLPLTGEDDAYSAVRFLAERNLLPGSWEADTLAPETWAEMVSGVSAWYGFDLSEVTADNAVAPTKGQLLNDLAAVIERAAPQLEPVALLAFDPQGGGVNFWAIIRNGGVYPRMIVQRPPEEIIDARRDTQAALSLLGSCAYTLSNYVSAPANTAQRLFLANSNAEMVIAQADPPAEQRLVYVPGGEEAAYLRFSSPATDTFEQYAALFVGPSIGVPALLRVIPQLRTNMNPREIIAFVQGS